MDEAIDFDPAVLAQEEPFTLVPRIADILRTSYCVPGSLFLVEGLKAVPISRSGRWQAIRLLLGDGELCVQGLLDGAMHRFVETGEVAVGCYLQVDKFQVRWQVTEDDGKQMVYLVLEDLVTVGWNQAYREAHRKSRHAEELADEVDLDREEDQLEYGKKEADVMQAAELIAPVTNAANTEDETSDGDMEDAFEAFEAHTFPTKKAGSSSNATRRTTSANKGLPIALARDWHDPQSPLKLTTLRSIPHLPYAQNWSCNVLAIIASISEIEASHLPPYRQRTAKLADPSTAKHVHLTIFLDPESFAPAVGSAVLLVGVKNHRFDGGSLKKYASDKDAGRWWFENPWELAWCDVGGIKQWWEEAQSSIA